MQFLVCNEDAMCKRQIPLCKIYNKIISSDQHFYKESLAGNLVENISKMYKNLESGMMTRRKRLIVKSGILGALVALGLATISMIYVIFASDQFCVPVCFKFLHKNRV